VPQESSIMNTLSDITLLFVFSHFRKKLDILISVASFFRKFEILWVAFLIPSGTSSLVKYPVLTKPNIQAVSAKTFELNNSVIFQRIFVKLKIQIF
jgi:hypothetical protein